MPENAGSGNFEHQRARQFRPRKRAIVKIDQLIAAAATAGIDAAIEIRTPVN
jgi:hypothetical protein